MLREAHALLAANAPGVKETLSGALDRQHFVGPCPRCGGALLLQRSPRGSRWIQCANNPASCPVTYALPNAGFVEPAPEFLCGVCKAPRLKITFRGQRPELYCVNPECAEHHRAFRIGTCPVSRHPLEIRYSFLGKRFVGCTGYPDCRVTYPLPQRGRLDKDHPPCPTCGAPVVTAIEAGRPPWTLCINPECPTRAKEPAARGAKKAAAPAPAAGRRTRAAGAPRRRAASRGAARAKRPASADAVPAAGSVPAPP